MPNQSVSVAAEYDPENVARFPAGTRTTFFIIAGSCDSPDPLRNGSLTRGTQQRSLAQNWRHGWQTYGTRLSLLSHFLCIPFVRPASLYCKNVCIYTHIWLRKGCIWITVITKLYYEWNICTQIGSGASVDWIFINGAPAWRWLGDYVTLDKIFYSLLFE